MPYRVEDSPNARAGCKNKECKDDGAKIQKGELRFGSQVTIKEHTTWAYKHWGCVTPAQIANWNEENGGDPELIDGYDELCPESKAKVDYALEHGHVADEDWKGDVEVNRPGKKGFRAKASKAKGSKNQGKKDTEDDEEHVEVPKAQGKRGRVKREDDGVEEEAPAPKKARGKKVAPKEVEQDDTEESEPPKTKRGKKAAPKKAVDDDDAADEEPKPAKSKRGKKAAVPDNSEKTVPQKRSGRKKAAVNYEED